MNLPTEVHATNHSTNVFLGASNSVAPLTAQRRLHV